MRAKEEVEIKIMLLCIIVLEVVFLGMKENLTKVALETRKDQIGLRKLSYLE